MKEVFNKIGKYTKTLYYVYIFLFVFLMINREFLAFGIDLRFVLLPLGLLLISYELINKKYTKADRDNYFDKDFKLIFLFYIWLFISNISWIWNDLEINQTKFINEIILLVNNFIGLLVFFLYKKYFKKELLNIIVVFSCIILVFSFVLLGLGLDMTQIFGSNERCIYVATEESPDHINIFGGKYRIGGYAQDPNYASLFLIIAIVSSMQLKTKKTFKVIMIALFLIALGFSASKTIMLASLLGIIYIFINKITNFKYKKKINIIVLLGIICIILIILNFNKIRAIFPATVTNRILMWGEAAKLFSNSPIIGNGITSFRSFFDINNWYVQSHSTYMQILSETGVIGLILFFIIMYNNLNKTNLYNKFLLIVYLVFAINFETIALQIYIYILYLINIENKFKPKGKKALFMINTLSNGGAERVCINMANELVRQNYNVDFILLNYEKTYEINSRIHIYDLKINESNKIKRILKIIMSVPKINEIIRENEQEEEYSLITSHLPMSNLLTRFSIIRDRAIYVFHITMKFYDKMNHYIFKKVIKFVFNNKKIVTVSKGLENECINEYDMNYAEFKTIYNPIRVEDILEKKNEQIDNSNPYILQIGRICQQKRPDRMLEVFYKGNFYKKYDLLFCGTGDKEETIKEKAKKLGIEEKIKFLGWQDNIYKWMENCEVLVSTSDAEAFPMTLIEAMVCNTKIVSSDCEFGPNEIMVGEYSDFLVEKDEINDYIKKINIALEKYPDSKNPIIKKCYSKNVIKEYIDFME